MIKYSGDLELSLLWNGVSTLFAFDEAGRGALAGPVTVGCVLLNPLTNASVEKLTSFMRKNKVRESKKLSYNRRIDIYSKAVENDFSFNSGDASNKLVDIIGIIESTRIAACSAYINIANDNYVTFEEKDPYITIYPSILCIYDNGLPICPRPFPAGRTFSNGDDMIASIAMASIIAKVSRDLLMEGYDRTYPQYNFIP